MHMKLRFAAAVAVAGTLAAAAAAHASAIAVHGACFVTGAPVSITGSGFTAGAPVSIGGGAVGSTVADASGNNAATVAAPLVRTVAPRTISISATDRAEPADAARAA